MTPERLAELEKIIRSYGSPNCWTGTSGTLATAAFELLAEIKRMQMLGADLMILGRMARRLGVTATWLRAEADAGRVPCLRAGRRYLFAPSAVQEALAVRAASETTGAF